MSRIAALSVAFLLAVGCASPGVSVCREAARCADEDPDQCIDDARSAEDDARDAGCLSEYNAAVRCLDRHSSCQDGQYTIDSNSCSEELQDQVSCYIDAAL